MDFFLPGAKKRRSVSSVTSKKVKIRRHIIGRIRAQLEIRGAPNSFVENVLSAFTYPNPQYEAAVRFSPYDRISEDIPKTLTFADYDKGTLYTPRGIDPEQDLNHKNERLWNTIKWRDERASLHVNFPKRRCTLNQAQTTLVDAVKNALGSRVRPFDNYLLISPTSSGKTTAQAACAALTEQRTLVLCVTNLIKVAWMDDLKRTYGLKPKDIGLIQQSAWRIGDHFTLASVATLCKRQERWPELFDQIGCVIIDECHKVSEPRIYHFLSNCPAKYVIGASATPRADTFPQVSAIFGHPLKMLRGQQKDTESSMRLHRVKLIRTNFEYEYDRANLDYADLCDHISSDEDRNRLIVTNAINDWKDGHSVLIVVKRRAHLWILHEMLHERGVRDANVLYGGTNPDKKYTKNLIEMVLNRKVRMIVSVIEAITLGANLNPLNRLHLAMPTNAHTLEQLIGRIRRRSLGKVDTQVTYYLDMKVAYLRNKFTGPAMDVFRKLRVKGLENVFMA